MKKAVFGSILGQICKSSDTDMTGPVKLLPSSTSLRFLKAITFSRYVPFSFDSNRQANWNIKQRTYPEGISMEMFSSLLIFRQ